MRHIAHEHVLSSHMFKTLWESFQIDAAVGSWHIQSHATTAHASTYMDANSQFGIVDDKQVESDSIGTHGLGNENGMDTQIREFPEAWHIYLPFTLNEL